MGFVKHRLSVAECGMTRAQFAKRLRPVIEGTVTDRMLDALFDKFDADCDGMLNEVECERLNRAIIERINHLRTALIVVDFQNDFVSGTLAVKNGSAQQDPTEALVPLNRLLDECSFSIVIYTKDWHPYNHISFWEHCRNSDRQLCAEDRSRKLKPFDIVRFENPDAEQKLFPTHCVQNSWGADLDSQMRYVKGSAIVKKGTDTFVDAFSAFADNKKERSSELEHLLRAKNVDGIFVCGLAYEICVTATACDGVDLGFLTALITDCSKGLNEREIEKANEKLMKRNVPVIRSELVERIAGGSCVPWQWICSLCAADEQLYGQ